MRRSPYLVVWVVLCLAGCGSPDRPEPAGAPAGAALAPARARATGFPGGPLPSKGGTFFSSSGACAVCHTRMVDEAGVDVSVATAWRATMMANAARDPYWQATVRSESQRHPHLQSVIEDKCAGCHMPMAHFTLGALGGTARVLDAGLLDPSRDLHILAMEGVSCTLCHQIRSERSGGATSSSGGYEIDHKATRGMRKVFGPYPVDLRRSQLMQGSSGFIPVEGPHVGQAALCGTCHALYTPFVDAEGKVAGTFPEQMSYFEWLASSFGATVPCQNCHMPLAEGKVRLSVTGGEPRSPLYQHAFAGGNAFVLRILETFGQDLGVTASSLQFRDKRARVEEQLRLRTASLRLSQVAVDGPALTVYVTVTNLAGHKFPTGYPARRAWIHLAVKDTGGQVVFESGATNPDGSIAGNDNDADPAAYEPHYLSIDSQDQVQIYEAILGNVDSRVTTSLLSAARYLKNNRLLPAGLNKHLAADNIAVHGAARTDGDFGPGSDRVAFRIPLGSAHGPYTVTAELLYQAVGFRWAQSLAAYDAAEPQRFLGYYSQIPDLAVMVASAVGAANR